MDIISRASWGARPPRRQYRPGYTTETFLHHSVGYGNGGAAYMRQMQNQHMAPGWAGTVNGGSDIAYNHVIDPQTLKVYEGRGWGVAPGAQRNHNTGTWALCIMGDFRTQRPSERLLALIADLTRHGHELGHLPLELTGGHRDAPDQNTTCPGDNLHSQIPTIRNLLEDTMPTVKEIALAVWRRPMRDDISGAKIFAETQLRLAREDSYRAKVDAAVARRLAEELAARSPDVTLDVGVLAAEIADQIEVEMADRVADELAGRLED